MLKIKDNTSRRSTAQRKIKNQVEKMITLSLILALTFSGAKKYIIKEV